MRQPNAAKPWRPAAGVAKTPTFEGILTASQPPRIVVAAHRCLCGMAKRQIIPLLLGIALIIMGALGLRMRVRSQPTWPLRAVAHPAGNTLPAHPGVPSPPDAAVSPKPAPTLSSERNIVRAALWSEIIGPTAVLHLSPAQIERLIDDVIAAREQRQRVEAALPRTVQRDDAKAVIMLPPYPDAGRQIKVGLFAQLEQDFPGQAQAIETATHNDLGQLLSYFGQTRQMFVVQRQADTGRLVLVHGMYRANGDPTVPIEMTGTIVGTDDEFRAGEFAYLYPLVAGLK